MDGPDRAHTAELAVMLELSLGSRVGQLRAVPVDLGAGAPRAILVVYCADFDVDPYVEMLFFPTDTLKMALITEQGEVLWRRDLGAGVVPGVWFCPVFAFDLDRDGVDEIYFVNNVDPNHPLGLTHYHLECLNPRDGSTRARWPWPDLAGRTQTLSHTFRNFILGGNVRGEPILVTAQGTYGDMFLQAWTSGIIGRWKRHIRKNEPGARGSHMCAITDLNGDGVQEVMWGERCIDFDTGADLFCADRDEYRGHSDVVLPIRDRATDRWFVYTCRESDPGAAPRVTVHDSRGQRVWGHIDHGHMDLGWVAHLSDGSGPVAAAVRIGEKTCGPDGRVHLNRDEFAFHAFTGRARALPFGAYGALPADLSGDGYHELVHGIPGQDGAVVDHQGSEVGRVGGTVAMLSKVVDAPGEQILAYYPDGTIRIWGDRHAEDRPEAVARYANPLYRANQRLTAVGYNLPLLGGL